MCINIITNKLFMILLKTCSICLGISLLSSCGPNNNSSINASGDEFEAGHGPFDDKGNYRVEWADSPPKRRPKEKNKTTIPPRIAYTLPKNTYTPPKKKYAPSKKTAPKKITPKTRPPVTHIVKKGDTLYGLTRKYGSSVSLIQKANKITGTSIRIGQRLIIPRK